MEKITFRDLSVILRPYDLDLDPLKLVKYLFTSLNSQEGIAELKEDAKFFQESPENQVRLVAEIDGELYSTLTLIRERWEKDKFRVYSVVTAEKFRGTGLSKSLFNYACKWVKQHGGRLLLVDTWADNHSARKYYEKIGFKQYGVLPNGLENRKEAGYIDQILYYYDLGWTVP